MVVFTLAPPPNRALRGQRRAKAVLVGIEEDPLLVVVTRAAVWLERKNVGADERMYRRGQGKGCGRQRRHAAGWSVGVRVPTKFTLIAELVFFFFTVSLNME